MSHDPDCRPCAVQYAQEAAEDAEYTRREAAALERLVAAGKKDAPVEAVLLFLGERRWLVPASLRP